MYSLYPVWGPDLPPWDQESHVLQNEPARHPCGFFLNVRVYILISRPLRGKKKKKISSHFRLFSGTSFLKEELLGQRIWVSLTPFSCSQNILWQPVDCLLKKAQEGTDSVAPCSLLPRKVSVGGQCAAASLTSFSSVGRVTECTSSPCRSSQGLGKSVSRFQFSPLYREGALRGT